MTLACRLQELFHLKNSLEPPDLIENFESIIYSPYETEEEIADVHVIFDWYEEQYDDESVRQPEEYKKITSFLSKMMYDSDDGYFTEEEEEEEEG